MSAETRVFPFDVDKLIEICRRYGVSRIGIFGSMARGDDTPESDIDLLVEYSAEVAERTGLFAVVALQHELETALGREVDLVTDGAIGPYLRPNIMRDLRVIYEA